MEHSENLRKNARRWLVDQITEGKADSGLAQRFHLWLRQQSGGEMSPRESVSLFVSCCAAEFIKANVVKDRWSYGIYPDGIVPQPESDYVGPVRKEVKP